MQQIQLVSFRQTCNGDKEGRPVIFGSSFRFRVFLYNKFRALKDGYKALVEDFRTVVLKAKNENPGKKLVVMGHSMGSFICRLYTAWYPEDGFDGAIYMGTGGPSPVAGVGKTLSSLIGTFKGKKHKSKSMDKIAFGSYGKNLEGRTNFDWLTRDTEIVDRYIADPYCGYLFTVQGMNDLIRANMESNTDEVMTDILVWMQAI